MRTLVYYLLLLVISSLLFGCSFIGKCISGVKDPVHLSYAQIDNAIVKVHIPEGNTYVLDSVYENFLQRISSYSERLLHDHGQPLQIYVYDAGGKLISFHINCYADGVIHLKWNVDGRFDVVPPISAVPLDTTLNASSHLSMILNYKTGLRLSNSSEKYDYLFIVHWALFFKRQSKGLVKFIEKYVSAHPEYKIKAVYVNDDNLYR